jgi:hypothetical protein
MRDDSSSKNIMNETSDRSSKVQSRLKQIYSKTVLPVEKRFQYDFFYESPFLTDVEFDCKYFLYLLREDKCTLGHMLHVFIIFK